MDKLIPYLTPLISMLTFLLGFYFNKLNETSKRNKEIQIRYLNGLRLYLEETFWRLFEISQYVSVEGSYSDQTLIKEFTEIKKQDKYWFVNEGYYLISTSYLIACLFGTIQKIREEHPYIFVIRKKDDTAILNKAFKISLAFLKDESIYYVLQHNIGNLMYKKSEERFLNYAEFVELIVDDKSSIFFEKLVNLIIDFGERKKKKNIELALESIQSLSIFLEEKYGLGPTIENRLELEKNK